MTDWGAKKYELEPSPPLTDEEKIRRAKAWEQMPRYPGTVSCLDPECEVTMTMCRETPEGVYCRVHYVLLPVCVQCGEPGTQQIVRRGKDRKRVVLCRNCFCGPIDEDYFLMERCLITSMRSPSGFSEERIASSQTIVRLRKTEISK